MICVLTVEGEAVHSRPAPAQRQTSNIVESQPLRPELESMVQSCKAVVPQVPIHVLRKEILKTQVSYSICIP